MSQTRLLQILGLTLAVLVIAIAAFAVGVVVGTHGWLRWNPEAALGRGVPGGLPPNSPNRAPSGKGGGQPPNPLGGLPAPPQVVGRLRQYQNDLLTLATPQGPRSVQLTDSTTFRTEEGGSLTLADLKPGDWLAVWGTWRDPATLEASFILRLKTPPPRPKP